ncbi:MAG TPA: M56 family metallopeptidase [Blastocatellia bacterium]|nr:M56 family metallopeptidase [Blastocatellia bacterium]
MGTINRLLLSFLLNAAWQIVAITLVASLCDRLLRNAAARCRHWLWVMTLALSLLLPLSSLMSFQEVYSSGLSAGNVAQAGSVTADTAASPESSAAWLVRFFNHRPAPFTPPQTLAFIIIGCYLFSLLSHAGRFHRAWQRTNEIRCSAHAREFTNPLTLAAARCREAFGLRHAVILCSPAVTGPVTAGLRHPVIILPESLFDTESAETLTSAIGHEMVHIRRRDFALNLIYEVLYLPIAFHPAAALVKRQVSRTRELACDEAVAGRLVSATVYARSLVRLADSISNAGRPAYTVGVFDADILEERIMKLTDGKPRIGTRAGIILLAGASLVLTATGIAASSLSLKIAQDQQASAGSDFMVGDWDLIAINDQNPDEALSKFPFTITLKAEGGKLTGKVIFPVVTASDDGPKVTGHSERALTDPKFDGRTFTFKVDNGQEFLIGELKLTDGKFEGRWKASKSEESGTLKMSRKK